MRASAALLVCLALLAPRTGQAQHRDPLPSFPPVQAPHAALVPSPPAQPVRVVVADTLWAGGPGDVTLIMGGVAGGTLGFIAGGLIGSVLDGPPDDDCSEICFGDAVIPGVLIGEALGLALGVHLANGRRGSFPTGALVSAGILAVGVAGMLEEPEIVFLIPVGQLVGAIYAERRTDRYRHR
jgi:hypothetical protein